MSSPTQRTLKHMRKQGCLCDVVEKWIPQARRRKDLFGFIDVLCTCGEDVVGVQSTSYSNTSSRIKKIEDHENLPPVRRAGIRVLVHGWRKVKNRWQVREVDIS